MNTPSPNALALAEEIHTQTWTGKKIFSNEQLARLIDERVKGMVEALRGYAVIEPVELHTNQEINDVQAPARAAIAGWF